MQFFWFKHTNYKEILYPEIAYYYFYRGDFYSALSLFEKSDNYDAILGQAKSYAAIGNINKAIEKYISALEINPNFKSIYYNFVEDVKEKDDLINNISNKFIIKDNSFKRELFLKEDIHEKIRGHNFYHRPGLRA